MRRIFGFSALAEDGEAFSPESASFDAAEQARRVMQKKRLEMRFIMLHSTRVYWEWIYLGVT